MTKTTIGIDVSKATLDAYRLSDRASCQVANTPEGHAALIAWCGTEVERVVLEPTGPYHRGLELALGQAGLPIVKVNPRYARRFAEATGRLAKTDKLDAAILARMGVALDMSPKDAVSQELIDLRELIVARKALIGERTAVINRGKWLTLDLLKSQNTARLRQIVLDIKAVNTAIKNKITADPALSRRYDILRSIPGIGLVAAMVLLIEMPELGTMEQGQAASLAGLAPMTRQSGQWRGRAHIHAGRATVRTGLYMPALVAARRNPDLKAKYESLIAAGKTAKVAITAIMRKLVVLANALLKKNKEWEPKSA